MDGGGFRATEDARVLLVASAEELGEPMGGGERAALERLLGLPALIGVSPWVLAELRKVESLVGT